MRTKRKYLAVVVGLSLLLLGISFLSVSASEISMDGAIGFHKFNLNGEDIESLGLFILTNQGEEEAVVKLSLDSVLKPTDLDNEGNPRTHSVIKDVVFDKIPDISWITLNETKVTIPSGESKKIYYTIEVPRSELSKMSTDVGFLAYVTTSGGGEQVNVNYNHKVFIVFEGNYESMVFYVSLLLAIVFTAVVYSLLTINKKRKVKKTYK